ncbi:MAG: radical SAM protein [Candidatus ainarchaeum sp.]|nr:radical SAM protein [Candidatus ainarchaeum sp.]
MGGSIVYSFLSSRKGAGALYVNVTNNCTNSCRFCGREAAIEGKRNIYEEKAGVPLVLGKRPEVEDIIREVEAKRKKPFLGFFGGTKEIAFVGLGEPLLEFGLVCNAIHALRYHGYRGRIRIDTNGQVGWPILFGCHEVYWPNPAHDLKLAGLTDIVVSLNATSAEEYAKLCRPQFETASETAFEIACKFIRNCISEGIRTSVSFVVGFDDGEVRTQRACDYIKWATSCFGIQSKRVIIGQYVKPILEG